MPTVTIDIPRPHTGQRRIHKEAARFNVLECGRRWGKTTMGQNLAAETGIQGKLLGWFAPTYKYLDEPWSQLCRILKPIIIRASKIEKRIELATGGVLDFWTMDDADCGRGRKYHRAILDEAGISKNLREAWEYAIRPTLTDHRGDAWFLGTPKGRAYFHQLYARGQDGTPGWKSWRLATADNPYMPADEVEDARLTLPQHVFEQEYMGIPADDGGNPFNIASIRACVGPQSTAVPVAFGIDLAKSQDWTWVVGLDAEGRECVSERWQGDWGNTKKRVLATVNGWPTLIDSTGVGDPIVEELQRVRPNIRGFKFSSTSKQQLMEGLASAIHQQAIRFHDDTLISELESFEYEYTRTGVRYSAPSGLHDDGVCALALAWQQFKATQHNVVDVRVMGGFKSDPNNWTGDDDSEEAGWTRL